MLPHMHVTCCTGHFDTLIIRVHLYVRMYVHVHVSCRSIVSTVYSCGWSGSWKNRVIDVELHLRGSVSIASHVHSALAGCCARHLRLYEVTVAALPSSPPSHPPLSPESPCSPSLQPFSSTPHSSPFQHHQPSWPLSPSPIPSSKHDSFVDSNETRLVLSHSPPCSPDTEKTRLVLSHSPPSSPNTEKTRLALSSHYDSDETIMLPPTPKRRRRDFSPELFDSQTTHDTTIELSPPPCVDTTKSFDSDETRLVLSHSPPSSPDTEKTRLVLSRSPPSSPNTEKTRLALSPPPPSSPDTEKTRLALSSHYDSDETIMLPPTPKRT